MIILNKMKNKTYHPVGTVPTSKRKIVERSKINTCNTQIYDRSFAVLVAGTSVKRVKLVV
jgi:hypothetical protein